MLSRFKTESMRSSGKALGDGERPRTDVLVRLWTILLVFVPSFFVFIAGYIASLK